MKKVLFIGHVDKFVQTLMTALIPFEKEVSFTIVGQELKIKSVVQHILDSQPDVIIWSYEPATLPKFLRLMKFISHDEQTCHISKVLICFEQHMNELRTLSCAFNTVFFVRVIDVKDIVYYLKCILLSGNITAEHTAQAFFHNKINLFAPVKVRSMGRDFAEIESNCFWANGSQVEIDLPLVADFHVTRKHTLEQRSEADIQTEFKFSYKITYKYDVQKFRPEDRIKILEDMRYKLVQETVDENILKKIIEIDKKSKTVSLVTKKAEPTEVEDPRSNPLKNLESCARAMLANSLFGKINLEKYYFNTISIYDKELTSLDNNFATLQSLGTSINWRRSVVNAAAEIKRDKPSVIVINYSEQNGFEQVKQIAAATTQFRDYFPFILLFNFDKDDIDAYRHTIQYHYIIGTTIPINESLISKLIVTYRTKRMSKEQLKAAANFKELMTVIPYFKGNENLFLELKIFYPPQDTGSILEAIHPIEIIWMSEFEIVFFCRSLLAVGDIYSVEIPIRFNIVIIPHIAESRESTVKDCYRAFIHFIKESDKQAIRRFINHVYELSETRKGSIKEDEIREIKRQYFKMDS
jgi:hypothetical protein